jgi:hypothetical protein
MKKFTPIFLASGGYAVVSVLLVVLAQPTDSELPLLAWYFISWPASHLVAREPLAVQILCGCLQYAILGALWMIFFGRKRKIG